MAFLKKSLLYAGIPTVCVTAISVPIILSQSNNVPENYEQINILERAGLDCGRSPGEGSECVTTGKGGIRLKVGERVEEGIKFSDSPEGKLILRKSKSYSYGLRLAVEGGDIVLGGANKTFQKLKRFESFGIEEGEKGELQVVRKANEHEGVMMALGLPRNCLLPLDGKTKKCSISPTQLKGVHFEGRKEGGATITHHKNTTLEVSRSVDTNLFKEGYRFAFYSTSEEITINNENVIKIYAPTEFTVKEWRDGDMVLVRAASGNNEEELFKKVGISCESSGSCTIDNGKLSVIQGKDRARNNLTLIHGKKAGGSGNIKLYRNQPSYINGLEFFIEGGDINIVGSSSSPTINKLSQKDGYEILETGGKFYLNRKCSDRRVLLDKEKKMGFCDRSLKGKQWITQ